ncbi:MAG: zinc-dependent alcohol dehydrogenase [Spirochaetota bacterium]
MQALVLTKYSNLEIQDVPVPEPGANEVRVRVRAVGICGSDVHGYDGSSGRRIPPIIMGHEASGEIDALGEAVEGWRVGERVTFDSTIYPLDDWYTRHGWYNLSDGRQVLGVSTPEFKRDGCYAEYVVIPAHVLYRIPDGISFEHAALVEPYAVGMHAVHMGEVEAGQTAAVVGCGTIGLGIVQILAASGLRNIVAVDLDTGRRELAMQMGATHEIDPRAAGDEGVAALLQDLTDGRGADRTFEAVGMSAPLNTAIAAVRRGGTVVIVGNLKPDGTIPMQKIVTHQIRLQGSFIAAGEFETVLALLAAGRLSPDLLISEVTDLEHAPRMFERLYNAEPGLLKVILRPRA